MSEKDKSVQLPIRVSLRFCVRSDVTLVRKLETISPYQRPKFLRQLIKDAWHSRRRLLAGPTAGKTLATDT
jgi:hypothetical protein